MTAIIYTAKRELTGLNAVDSSVLMEIGISDLSSSRAVIKDVQRAKGGARETLYHRTDETHAITFQPVNGQLRNQLREFLASTESGETFQIYLYGTESTPIQVVREDDGHTDSMFMAVGTSEKDYVQASITVMEA
jgi:hypothetical protein